MLKNAFHKPSLIGVGMELIDVSSADYTPTNTQAGAFILLIETGGQLKVQTATGEDVTQTFPAGVIPCLLNKVYNDAGNTAGNLTAIY